MQALLLCVCTVALTRHECNEAFLKFTDECDGLSELDRSMARLRYVPYYKRLCSRFEHDWDELNARCFANDVVTNTVVAAAK
jgi:hypothetical protein